MTFYLSVFDFAGRMHPVLVHLPIGILMLVCLYYIFVKTEKRQGQRHFINTALFWGMLSAVGACVSGLALANSGDYDASAVSNHQWLGIATAVVSIICYIIHKKRLAYTNWFMWALVVLITVAGHLGGSITHGENYLTAPFTTDDLQSEKTVFKPMPNIQEAFVYNDIIKPILSSKCYACHGTSKQKGKLRLDDPDFILKGGKEGAAIAWDHADESILIERILLPESDEDHMPPKEKPQLTKAEMDLLQWWVNSGAGFNKKVSEAKQTDKIKPTLLAIQNGVIGSEAEEVSIIPEKETEAADPKAIEALKEHGVVVIPVADNSNYLLANFVSAEKVNSEVLKLLEPLKNQLVWLKVADENLSDKDMETIGKLTTLMRLHVEGNPITDAGLKHFKNLSNLQYINLSETKITQQGLLALKGLKNLKKIYLYQIPSKFDLAILKKNMPEAVIDTGGYVVPTLQSDTTIYKVETAPM